MNKIALMAALTTEEGYRALAYDDATGLTVKPGTVLRGNVTIAIGWNVMGRPCPPDLAQIILGYFVDQTWAALTKDYPWVEQMPESVQRGLTDMAYNLGESGLDGFATFLSLLQQGKYVAAADDLTTTLWARQVGSRAQRVETLIRQGAAS